MTTAFLTWLDEQTTMTTIGEDSRVEELLMEIGILDDDDSGVVSKISVQSEDFYDVVPAFVPSGTTKEPPSDFVPVSPDKKDENLEVDIVDDDYLTLSIIEQDTDNHNESPNAVSSSTTTSKARLAKGFIPVSPERKNEHPATVERNLDSPGESMELSSFAENVETLTKFSVPNPLANFVVMPPASPKPKAQEKKTVSLEPPSKLTQACNKRSGSSSREGKGRKRKEAPPVSDEEPEEMSEEKRQRNRDHAKRSRQRKKALTVTLQQTVEKMKAKNNQLRQKIYSMIGKKEAEAMLSFRKNQANENFISGLMIDHNRILDDSTLKVLKTLRTEVLAQDGYSSP